ncbi:MAG TPA: response regulator transcription factor [Thermoanaerobaculia bacterium]|nr:response regulator transcription factor [Thermoanaerobaculia bacterium]
MKRILLVEDERGMQLMLRDALEAEGYAIEIAGDGEAALASSGPFDAIVLDLMLPKKNGLDVCRELRQRGETTPILMLTARGETYDKVVGLKLGADDYLVKPFAMAELLARLEALLRRPTSMLSLGPDAFAFGDVRVDFRRALVTRKNEPVELSALELRLLRYFIEHRDEVLTRDRLLDEVWGYKSTPATRTVDVHIVWLRQKLEEVPAAPRHLLTIHGVGYKFVV